MFIIKILRYLRGIIYFKASGGFPERFLNLCSKENIVLDDVMIKDGILTSSTDLKGYRKIRKPAKKSGMRVRIAKKSGLPFLIFKRKNRLGLVFGAVMFFGILAFLSSFIWTVSVSGCSYLNEHEIIRTAESLGLKPGVKRKKIDVEKTENKLCNKYENIAFAAVNLKGSCAEIKIMEKPPVEPNDSETTPCDIVANKDGQIITLENFCGTKLLKENAAVLKGDTIISSVVENRDGTYAFKRAKAYVTAKTNLTVESRSSFDDKLFKVSKLSEKKELFFFNLRIPLYKGKPQKGYFKESVNLYLNDFTLPVGITKKRNLIIAESKAKLTPKMAEILALEEFCNKLQGDLMYKDVLDSSFSFTKNRISAAFKGDFVLLENIGIKKALKIQNN